MRTPFPTAEYAALRQKFDETLAQFMAPGMWSASA
jgi:hypothetical protein